MQVVEIRTRQIIRKNNGRITGKQFEKLIKACSEGSSWKTNSFHKTIIQSQVRELQNIISEIKIIQEALDEYCLRFNEENKLLQSVPGVSKQIAYMYLAVIGDHNRFDLEGDNKGAKRVSNYLGYGLIEYSSGPRSSKSGISKRGNSRLRGLLYMAGL